MNPGPDQWFYKMRVRSGWVSILRKHPGTVGWSIDPFPIGGRRNLNIRNDAGEWYPGVSYRIWDDGLVPLAISRKSGKGVATVQVLRTSGLSGAPIDVEELIDEHVVLLNAESEGRIEDYVQLNNDEYVRDEIARCLEAEAIYWYDMDGRWHAAFRLKLIDDPNLLRRRYTFGGDRIRSISRQEELTGQAWWALNPTDDGGWELIHEDEYVLMHGWADESIDPGPYGHIANLRVLTNPKFCLRDSEASVVVEGMIRLKVDWERVQVHVN